MAVAVRSGEPRLTIKSASACRFALHGGGVIAVVVRRSERPGWSAEEISRMLSHPQRFREILGIGDRSFLFDMMENGAALCIFRGDCYVQVSAFHIAQPSTLSPALVAVARKVLRRF